MLTAAAAGASPPGGFAARGSFVVGLTVLSRTAVVSAAAPALLDISQADVRRGYVDAASATRLVVTNTNPRGFALDVWPVVPVFEAVSVRGTGGTVTIERDGGTIVERGIYGPLLPIELRYRFTLAPGTQPGSYPWPLHFSIRPLVPFQ